MRRPNLAGHPAWHALVGAVAGLSWEEASIEATLAALQVVAPAATSQIHHPLGARDVLLVRHGVERWLQTRAKMAIKMGNVERMEYVNNIKQLNVIGRGS
jgi:hypothetical protein